jgi:uncharacterized protein YyaL (SSP411 family)
MTAAPIPLPGAINGKAWHLVLLIVSLNWLTSCGPDNNPHSNQLSKSSSPYLREHADNPVHWQEWNDATLEFAAKENKPIIVSIGYAACHWCHVMERESFMDTAIARVMNENFVCIKVDREERPDLDQVYIQAAELTSGNAGWPLNAFALPDGRPFYAATYFPKDYWSSLLSQIVTAFRDDKQNLLRQAAAIKDEIKDRDSVSFRVSGDEPSFIKDFLAAVPSWRPQLDMVHGGLSGPNRFPMPAVSEFMLQHHYLTGDTTAREWVRVTLEEMAYGGIYDQIGGAFSRYAIDSTWHVPHFEKMLYDNAQLASLYAHAFQARGDSLYLRIVREILEFVAAELTSPEGAFYSSINADSEGEEGKYYVWTEDEITKALDPPTGKAMTSLYAVTKEGNWEAGKNILHIPADRRDEQNIKYLAGARKDLAKVRSARTRPSTDEKILASWNAMMIIGYIDAFHATGDQAYLDAALKNAGFLQRYLLSEDEGLLHSHLGGKPGVGGFLEDYAWTARAFIHLYEATFDVAWLWTARKLSDDAITKFGSADNALYFFTSKDQGNPITRKMEVYDNVIPSSNSVFAEVLFLLGEYFQNEEYTKQARDAAASGLAINTALGLYVINWARLAQVMDVQPFEVAITGSESLDFARVLQRRYLPTAIFMGGSEENLSLLKNKLVPGATTIYVCRNRVCKLPTTDIKDALRQLGQN